jgi:hypothetical protein
MQLVANQFMNYPIKISYNVNYFSLYKNMTCKVLFGTFMQLLNPKHFAAYITTSKLIFVLNYMYKN